MKHKFPQYLSSPYQVLWMETDDMAIFFILLLLFLMFPGWFWFIFMIVVTYLYTVTKKKYPRGFLKHVLYFVGLISFSKYPTFFENDFHE
jgi:energy-coupling factor transporter transmembrane protein EcfT